ncbi:MAG: TldD/PmbA family protein [Ignavibacteria bacterium]
MLLNKSESKKILLKVKEYSKADSFETALYGFNTNNLRFALNSISTDGFSDGLNLRITSNFGKKSGSVSINKVDDTQIKKAVEDSENIAKLSPDNQEYMPPLDGQKFKEAKNYSKSTEDLDFESRASLISRFFKETANQPINSSGYWEDESSFYSIFNSNGLFAYNKSTLASFSATIRTLEGNGSSRVQNQYIDYNRFDISALSRKVLMKSLKSVDPKKVPPGRYTVILEPAASADLIANLIRFMDAREADEGRSYFSKSNGGNRIGEKLVNDSVNIYSDPYDEKCPSYPYTTEGYPRAKTVWFENGILKNLSRSRYWAEKTSQDVVPNHSNILMDGTQKSVEDLISTTEKGILVTRFWYIRTVDPQIILLTGLTRDGLFEIRDGKVTNPVKNFRFNESPVNMLNNVVEIGKQENGVGSETDTLQIFVPSLKVNNFNFSSLSDAI